MFHQPAKKVAPSDAKPLNALTAILSAEQLLSEPKHQARLEIMSQSGEFEPAHLESLYLPLIHQVASSCQRLPESTLYYARPGGLLDHAMARTQAAVQLFRQYLIPDAEQALSSEQKRWWYVLFSASLLRGIGTLCLDYHIDRYAKGVHLKVWQPLVESIGHLNQMYAFEFKTSEDYALRRRFTLLLARRLIPEEGFAWIASSPETLTTWIALLDEDQDRAGALGAILDRADAMAIQHELNHLPMHTLTPTRERPTRIGTFVEPAAEPLAGKERLIGIEFIRWLQNKLESSQFILNRAPVFDVPGGLLICVEAFQLFVKEHVSYKNWHTVQHAMLALHLHHANELGAGVSLHEQGTGLVVRSTVVLPESFSVHHLTSGKTLQTTAVELALVHHPERISPAGAWVIPQDNPAPTSRNAHGA